MSSVQHRGSTLAVLAPAEPTGVGRVDAVIVPSGRRAEEIRTAAELAAGLDANLLALCNARSTAADVADVVRDIDGLRWHAVDADPRHAHPLLLRRPAVPGYGGRLALSTKRNIGLLTARMAGWDTVLFLDDDIRGIGPDAVRLAAGDLDPGGMGPASAVGFAVRDWPDNSVACHANRLAGGEQDVFVGGSALLVDTAADDLGHFPVVYNEDWMFLFDALAAGRVRRAGSVRQLPYDPFGDPQRGRSEEFGDVIAEGLVTYLQEGGAGVPVDPAYWATFLRRRATFLADVRLRLGTGPGSPRHRAARRAVEAAAVRSAEIRPLHCVRFLRGWRVDREVWRRRMAIAPRFGDAGEALRHLGLSTRWAHRPGGPAERSAAVRPPLEATVHRAATPRGTALIVPGFLDGRDSKAHRSLAALLPTTGLTAVTFDPRGTATSLEPLTAGPTEQLADIAALLDQYPDSDRHVLIGHCYGAWLAGLQAARDPRITEVVAIMPTRCFVWPMDYDEAADSWRRRGVRVFSAPVPGTATLRGIRVPHTVVDDARGYDLPAALASLTVPILFVAGAADDVIPAAAVQRLYDECGSVEKKIVVLPGVQHDYRDHPDQLVAVEATVVGWLTARRTVSGPA